MIGVSRQFLFREIAEQAHIKRLCNNKLLTYEPDKFVIKLIIQRFINLASLLIDIVASIFNNVISAAQIKYNNLLFSMVIHMNAPNSQKSFHIITAFQN